MQRVLQIGNRHAECVDMFARRFDVYNKSYGRQYISFCVECEDFDAFADTAVEAIATSYVRQYINGIISRQDCCFNLQERELILKDVFEAMDTGAIRSGFVRVACKNTVINFDGVFNFILRDFCNGVELICTEVADKYILKNEYLDFIRTLRFFASVNYGSAEVIHVVMRSNNRADLYDSGYNSYQVADSGGCCEFAAEMLYEYDSVISSLVEASPKSVVLHNWRSFPESELVETLVNVFDERVSFCDGCSLCNGEERC